MGSPTDFPDATHGCHAPHGVVVVGGSAGGVEALKRFAAGLPADLPHAVLVCLHMSPGTPSVLPQIMDRSGPLPATAARDGEELRGGHVYVVVPDRHLLVADGHVVVSDGPTENGHRPAINALFRSAAVSFGDRALGLLLSGVLDDGVLGLQAIQNRGGVVVVQEPDDALFPAMPANALAALDVDYTVTAAKAGQLIATLDDFGTGAAMTQGDPNMEMENRIAMGARFSGDFDSELLGPPSGYTCPDCNGSLVSLDQKSFRCRVGHAWTAGSLLLARDRETEQALWIALRSLREKAEIAKSQAERLADGALQRRYAEIAEETYRAAELLAERLTLPRRDAESRDEAG